MLRKCNLIEDGRGAAIRRLPQGCQSEHEYDDQEWDRFVACARRTWESGEWRHKELSAKLDERRIAASRVLRALWPSAALMAYRRDGLGEHIALWDPLTELFIVASSRDGLILSVYTIPEARFGGYIKGPQFVGLWWLHR